MASGEQSTRRVLLLASYCGDDNLDCTDSVPCRDCLGMCGIADIRGSIIANHGGIDHARAYGAPAPLVAQEVVTDAETIRGAWPAQDDCHRCWDERTRDADTKTRITSRIMFLCPTCGNKRCPKASDHRLACTGSNEPGQEGSIYV